MLNKALWENTQDLFFVDPEMLMQMMEQMSILFDCVRRAAPQEAQLLSEILPQVSLFLG